ncbi:MULTISPECIES: hypothetical protein [Eubacteriales]|uniref:Uncharacterized protein n=1 Tax=Allofournierella massiliensis TaxID=1650663 RepID=A0A4V2QBH1_9FIRM|nr:MULTISPECIES: hypothetical protein [Eubacteriales]OUP22975.1 hypothetical protein B5F28_13785 [Gemmiger sp. An194]TCL56432.1 hypothetical protein EDD77_11398 [Fournierella massiliensis]
MICMQANTRAFLEKNLPEALEMQNIRDVLEALYILIDEKGFAPPKYEDYNDFGREAQRAYDDLYLSNT